MIPGNRRGRFASFLRHAPVPEPEMARKSGGAGLLDPLQREKANPFITPPPRIMAQHMESFMNAKMEEARRSGPVQELALMNAVAAHELPRMMTAEEHRVNEQFAEDFMCFLNGKDPTDESDPAYVKNRLREIGMMENHGPFMGRGIKEWMGGFLERKQKYALKLLQLRMGPHIAFEWHWGHYLLWYKYILRNVPYTEDELLADFDKYFPHSWGGRPAAHYRQLDHDPDAVDYASKWPAITQEDVQQALDAACPNGELSTQDRGAIKTEMQVDTVGAKPLSGIVDQNDGGTNASPPLVGKATDPNSNNDGDMEIDKGTITDTQPPDIVNPAPKTNEPPTQGPEQQQPKIVTTAPIGTPQPEQPQQQQQQAQPPPLPPRQDEPQVPESPPLPPTPPTASNPPPVLPAPPQPPPPPQAPNVHQKAFSSLSHEEQLELHSIMNSLQALPEEKRDEIMNDLIAVALTNRDQGPSTPSKPSRPSLPPSPPPPQSPRGSIKGKEPETTSTAKNYRSMQEKGSAKKAAMVRSLRQDIADMETSAPTPPPLSAPPAIEETASDSSTVEVMSSSQLGKRYGTGTGKKHDDKRRIVGQRELDEDKREFKAMRSFAHKQAAIYLLASKQEGLTPDKRDYFEQKYAHYVNVARVAGEANASVKERLRGEEQLRREMEQYKKDKKDKKKKKTDK